MKCLRAEKKRAKAAKMEDILTESESDAIAQFLQDHDIDALDLSHEDFLSIVNSYRPAGKKLIPNFILPTRRSAHRIQQRKGKRDESDEYA